MVDLVFLLEEPSAKDLLQGLLPRILPAEFVPRYIVFQGKQDLERGIQKKLRAWRTPGARFVILRDQDSAECETVKTGLVKKCRDAGRPDSLVRVACRELESWIAGDLEAFAQEFSCPTARKQMGKNKFSDPDAIVSPVAELRRFHPQYQKRDGARRMGHLLKADKNTSRSFKAFCRGVLRLTASPTHE